METTELQVLLSVLQTEELNNRCAVTNERLKKRSWCHLLFTQRCVDWRASYEVCTFRNYSYSVVVTEIWTMSSRGWYYLSEVWLKRVHIRTRRTDHCLIGWWATGISKSQRMMAGAEWRWSLRSSSSSLLIMRRNKPRDSKQQWLAEAKTVYPETYLSRSWSSEEQGLPTLLLAAAWGLRESSFHLRRLRGRLPQGKAGLLLRTESQNTSGGETGNRDELYEPCEGRLITRCEKLWEAGSQIRGCSDFYSDWS